MVLANREGSDVRPDRNGSFQFMKSFYLTSFDLSFIGGVLGGVLGDPVSNDGQYGG